MKNLPGLAGRVFNVPLAIERRKMDAILHVLGPRLKLDEMPLIDAGLLQVERNDRNPYRVTSDGIACIDIDGTLVRKASGMDALSGLTSYQQIETEWCGAMEDDSVRGVLCCFDSPGGEVGGLFDLVDKLYAARGTKPVYAAVSETAASAAYAIASVCDQIFVTQTGCVGSIGVWAMHVDQSEFDKQNGLKFTYIYAGERKIDGNPHEPLGAEARKEFQDEVDRTYDLFVESVARNRNIGAKRVRSTEAGVFFGPAGVTEGLADRVGTVDDAVAALRAAIGNQTGSKRGKQAMPAIPPHKTATSDAAWDGPAAKKNLREGESQSYYEKAYAYRDADKDPETKSAYDFIHHEVSAEGEIGAANLEACESGIGILNGARGGTKLEGEDREGVYRHLSKHLRDAGKEPPELKSEAEVAAEFALKGFRAADASAAELNRGARMAEDKKKKDDADARKGDDEYMKKGDMEDGDPDDSDEDDPEKKKRDDDEDGAKKGMGAEQIEEIRQVCELAGVSEKAALDFISNGTSVADVRKALMDQRADKSRSQVIFTRHGVDLGRGMAALESQAREFARSQGISFEKAMDRMLLANPKAYADYRREMIRRQRAMELGIGGDFQMPGMQAAQPTQYDVHVNTPLNNISVGYLQDESAFVAADVFPNVPVLKQSDVYYKYTRADFNTTKFQPRAADGSSSGAGYRVSATDSYLCILQALHKDIPDMVRANMDAVLNGDRDATLWLTQQFLLKRELDFVQTFMKTGIWTKETAGGATVTGTFGNAGGTVIYWDSASSTPIEDVTAAGLQMQIASGGFRPTDFTVSRDVFNALKNHPDLVDRIKYGQTARPDLSPALVTKMVMAQLFEVQRINVMDAVYNTARDLATESNALVGGKNALLTYRPAQPGLLTPSAGYTFSWTGLFGMGAMGTRIKTFREEPKAKDVVEMEAAYDMKLVSADLGFFFNGIVQN